MCPRISKSILSVYWSPVFDHPRHMSHSGLVGLWKNSFRFCPPTHAYLVFFLLISTTDHCNSLPSPLHQSPVLLSLPVCLFSFAQPIPIIRCSTKPCLFSSKLSFLRSGVIHSHISTANNISLKSLMIWMNESMEEWGLGSFSSFKTH